MLIGGRRSILAALAAMLCMAAPAMGAEEYPVKPIRIVVPFGAGGPTDVMTRALAQKMTEAFRQSMIVDNRPGAGGNIGTDIVAKAPADGYTLLISTNGPLAANLTLFGKLPYDPLKDLAPVTLFTYLPNMLAVHPSVPARNVPELIALLKAKPGEYSFGSGGNGTSSHLSGELFKTLAGVRMNHIPYKGDGASMIDVIGGQVPIVFCSVLAGMRYLESGRLRALAVTSSKRVPAVPDLPAMEETGLPGYDLAAWYSVMAPAGTPREIIEKLNSVLVKIIRNTDLKEKIESMGGIPVGSTPEEVTELIKAEIPRWGKLVRESGAKVD
ncbi:MAG: tripartite tricarboxylate transporter substrate binding protein [Proteobacteria bacterium]|nr:tripartite tricarboxylate transporter substrate binding protein [Pseudomonadota bacterium]